MKNIFQGSIARHDFHAGISYLSWGKVVVRVPLVAHVEVGTSVTWEIPADQVRLPSNSKRPERPFDTPFAATVVRIEPDGKNIKAICTAQSMDGGNVIVIADAAIARDHGVVEQTSLILRLRGEHIRVRQPASK